jgi:hypothetical protein
VDARQDASKPVRRRSAPRLGPFFASFNPFIIGFTHRALPSDFLRNWESEIAKDWRVTIGSPMSQDRRMITKNIGMLVLAIYLILVGIIGFGVSLGPASILLPILALVAGILILIGK